MQYIIVIINVKEIYSNERRKANAVIEKVEEDAFAFWLVLSGVNMV